MKIAIQTLGCKVNQSESSSIEGLLRNNHYDVVNLRENPDIVVINTCTVTAKSDNESRQLVRKAVKAGAKVIATGCYAQLKPDELSSIDGVHLVIGNAEKSNIISHLDIMSNGGITPLIRTDSLSAPLVSQPYHSNRSRAFLKIQDGCNFSCSYCAVPLARGKSRSLGPQDILRSVDTLADDGYREIVITGIHIGSYGYDLKPVSSLLDLLTQISESHPQIRIRLSSLEPREFRMEFLDLIQEGHLCRHIHIPLQSGSDNILRKMKRGYSTRFYEQTINRIFTRRPDISIGTDIITGFPGESDKDFEDTVNFIKKLPFSYLHVFPYSKRPNTAASSFNNQVSDRIRKERVRILTNLSNDIKYNYMIKNIDCELDVIIEKKSVNGQYYKAISDNYLKLHVDARELTLRDRLKARVISMTDRYLQAQPLK